MYIKGISASEGYAIGKVFKLEPVQIVLNDESVKDTALAIDTLKDAIKASECEIVRLREATILKIGREQGEIFNAHIEILNDPELLSQATTLIETKKINPARALQEVADSFIQLFESMDDAYMRERAADIQDVSDRIIRHILGIKSKDLSLINERVILVAKDLTPSDTAQLNQAYIQAFVTNVGGKTSHSAIMAQSLEIPAIVGAKNIFETLNEGDTIIVDAVKGHVIVSPSKHERELYQTQLEKFVQEQKASFIFKGRASKTSCGHRVELCANIGSPNDIESVLKNDGEGVGLYRTEFLYMDNDCMPTEEEQYQAYKKVLEKLAPRPIIIRTLDIGGDKSLPYFKMLPEMNPFLGHRAIRLCFDHLDIFKIQLRALLRASVHGNLKIMFPMIATVDEFLRAKSIFLDVKSELLSESVAISKDIELGIMVEIPAAAVLADQFAKEVDFFSIGTNDLIQYTFAADRMNERVSYLYQPYNPSLLRLIKMVIDAAHNEGKWTGMCGAMAGDHVAIPLLIGLGLDEFSMRASGILNARALISKISVEEARTLADEALLLSSNEEVKAQVELFLKEKV